MRLTQYGVSHSELRVRVGYKKERSYISKQRFQVPLSIGSPFKMKNGGLKLYVLSSSPGLFDDDDNRYCYSLDSHSRLMVTDPGYTEAFRMPKAPAYQSTFAHIGSHAYFKYIPNPVIPYRESKTNVSIEVDLEDETSKFSLIDVLTSGRQGMGEAFDYTFYKYKVNIRRAGEEIYRENLQFIPEKFDLESFGLMEGYPHFCTIIMAGLAINDEKIEATRKYFSKEELKAGITQSGEDLVVAKIFGKESPALYAHAKEVIQLVEDEEDRFE